MVNFESHLYSAMVDKQGLIIALIFTARLSNDTLYPCKIKG